MQILTGILAAKEKRQVIRQGFARQGYPTISFNFNIPGYPKSNDPIKEAFFLVVRELKDYFTALRIHIVKDKIINTHDEAGDICFFPLKNKNYDLTLIKEELETFENQHMLGRLLDIDLFDTGQKPISSGKSKSCFLCPDKPAIRCMREQTHTADELMLYVQEQINGYLSSKKKEEICRELATLATQSVLMEVSLPGKPGLVCPESAGSHSDMDYHTFMNSTSAISSYFKGLALLGYEWDGIYSKSILKKLRLIGLSMEKAMYTATKGVNTQKGIIFLIGFSLFASAHVIKIAGHFDINLFRCALMLLNKGLVSKELENGWNKGMSHGEKCFNTFGKEYAGGIRKEVEEGLPTVFETAMPLLNELFPDGFLEDNQEMLQEKLLHVLIKIISVTNDTNVLYRKGVETLNNLKSLAQFTVKEKGRIIERAFYKDLMAFCKTNKISPGGAADLLAISIFIFQLTRKFKTG